MRVVKSWRGQMTYNQISVRLQSCVDQLKYDTIDLNLNAQILTSNSKSQPQGPNLSFKAQTSASKPKFQFCGQKAFIPNPKDPLTPQDSPRAIGSYKAAAPLTI